MTEAIPELEPLEAAARTDAVVLLDVREPGEWQAGRIEGAQHVPMQTLPGRLHELDDTQPVVAVCRSGQRSAHVTAFLRAHGFDAYNLRGGMKAWRDAGLPFASADGGPGRVV
jgi:rhodanese-related sulfurtransferase